MAREALQVNTAHLRALAATHGRAADEITAAVDKVSGVDSGVRTSHGVIASSTAAAIEAVQQARRVAGMGVAAESRMLSGDLNGAAGRYEAADHASGRRLDNQIQAGEVSSSPPARLGR